MDALIYPFKRRARVVIPNGNGFVDVVSSAMQFSAWYFGAMLSFHAALIRLSLEAAQGVRHG